MIWINIKDILSIHARQINEHGGFHGIRDLGLIESSLARPKNIWVYSSKRAPIYELAATYGHGLVLNHGFIDGNKRTAYVVTRLFLNINNYDLRTDMISKVHIFTKIAKI